MLQQEPTLKGNEMQSNLKIELLNTTALSRHHTFSNLKARIRTNATAQSTIVYEPKTTNPGPAFICHEALECPRLNLKNFSERLRLPSRYITRYIEPKYLNSAVLGTIRFGTTSSYRASENDTAGRLGDIEEARLRDSFSSHSGYYNSVRINRASLESLNISTPNGVDAIGVDLLVNDYCLCASSGEFAVHQARDLLLRGNGKLGAYITYDLILLLAGLRRRQAFAGKMKGMRPLAKTILYGVKDRRWKIGETYIHAPEREKVKDWLKASFVKPIRFRHENEVRILMLNPTCPGSLSKESPPLLIKNDGAIARSVVGSGYF